MMRGLRLSRPSRSCRVRLRSESAVGIDAVTEDVRIVPGCGNSAEISMPGMKLNSALSRPRLDGFGDATDRVMIGEEHTQLRPALLPWADDIRRRKGAVGGGRVTMEIDVGHARR